jgi:hypothetical protein
VIRRLALVGALIVPAALWTGGAPAGVQAPPRCHTADLHAYLIGRGGAAGTISLDVAFQNRSGHACFVFGYAGFGLEDAHHRPRPSRVTWGSSAARRDPGRRLVILAPGRAAFANVTYSDVPFGNERCRLSTWLEVTPPDERSHRLIPFEGAVCDHGHLTATALSRTPTPHG